MVKTQLLSGAVVLRFLVTWSPANLGRVAGQSNCTGDNDLLGNGGCDSINNNADCGYDAGDCCPCTCQDGFHSCGSGGYDCQDPSADCHYPDCRGDTLSIADGNCTAANNNADCGYDGGDCCACTCRDGLYTCGSGGYDCQDPNGDCDSIHCAGDIFSIGDGNCSAVNNNADCGYDGGDCCSCTCEGSWCRSGGGYDCQDPDASCFAGSGVDGEDGPSAIYDAAFFSSRNFIIFVVVYVTALVACWYKIMYGKE